MLTLNITIPFSSVSIVDFEQGNVSWALFLSKITGGHTILPPIEGLLPPTGIESTLT